jgi:hypothetical protein
MCVCVCVCVLFLTLYTNVNICLLYIHTCMYIFCYVISCLASLLCVVASSRNCVGSAIVVSHLSTQLELARFVRTLASRCVL